MRTAAGIATSGAAESPVSSIASPIPFGAANGSAAARLACGRSTIIDRKNRRSARGEYDEPKLLPERGPGRCRVVGLWWRFTVHAARQVDFRGGAQVDVSLPLSETHVFDAAEGGQAFRRR